MRLPARLQRAGTDFASTNPDRALQVIDKDFAIANFSSVGGGADRFHHLVHQSVIHGDFQLDLRQKVHHVLGAAIEFGMALLTAEALGLDDGDACLLYTSRCV